ncbi:hypothetical protein ACFFMP_12340 [Pseudoroseomonas cervicalis]|uniref:Tat pathway signal sequence domain protein n=1 Tax=Pseudoroseomonas cervicalis ATCC 49957 TaxID=525371 RepID=D5RIB4_9PROT|nr:hypothetical protein [Pseudoroseomonas cervicalis]EFH12941.1 hypothetical protein HMPREF0731_0824 [Pseudoroseomonas cervicalis ATCC 49957]
MAKAGALFLLLGAATILSGCGASRGVDTAQAAPRSISGVVCPPAGLVAVRDDNTHVRYAGADPSDPGTCLVNTPGGAPQRMVGGLISTHPVNDAQRREAIAGLFPLAVGKSTKVSYSLVSALVPHPQFFPTEETFRVAGETSYNLNGAARPAWVVEGGMRSQMDPAGNYTMIYNIDKETGVILSYTLTSRTGGNLFARPFRVTQLEVASR